MSRVTSGRGEVSASADAQPQLKIAAGYFSQWPATSKEPIAAIANATAQMDIKTALDVEPELLDQAAGWQNRRDVNLVTAEIGWNGGFLTANFEFSPIRDGTKLRHVSVSAKSFAVARRILDDRCTCRSRLSI